MKGMNFTTIALVLLVLVCIYWYYSRKRIRKSIHHELALSNGTFDKHAQNALENINNLECPTLGDHFTAARIIDLNAHEGRINNVHVLDDVVNKYMINLYPNISMIDAAEGKYDDENDKDEIDWFKLDQIENFAERHMDIMTANPHYNQFIEAVLKKRPKKVLQTIETAKEVADNKKEAFSTYVEENKKYTDDEQNVHDSAVNEHLRQTVLKLRVTTPTKQSPTESVQEIREAISKRYVKDEEKKKKALVSVEEMAGGKYNASLGSREDDLLNLVWSRTKIPINREKKEMITDAILESFSDMSNDGKDVVCANGRCARLIESLVLTDEDQSNITGAMTVEQIRNDALQKSNEILTETIKEVKNSPKADEEMKRVARSYEDPKIETAPEVEQKFKELVKDNIAQYLSETYIHRLSDRDFSNIKNHCLVAVESI